VVLRIPPFPHSPLIPLRLLVWRGLPLLIRRRRRGSAPLSARLVAPVRLVPTARRSRSAACLEPIRPQLLKLLALGRRENVAHGEPMIDRCLFERRLRGADILDLGVNRCTVRVSRGQQVTHLDLLHLQSSARLNLGFLKVGILLANLRRLVGRDAEPLTNRGIIQKARLFKSAAHPAEAPCTLASSASSAPSAHHRPSREAATKLFSSAVSSRSAAVSRTSRPSRPVKTTVRTAPTKAALGPSIRSTLARSSLPRGRRVLRGSCLCAPLAASLPKSR